MPLKLNVGLSKKVGLPDYGSLGASCGMELELDSSLLQGNPEDLHRHIRAVYVACAQAVQDELARQGARGSAVEITGRRAQGEGPERRGPQPPGQVSRGGNQSTSQTPKQAPRQVSRKQVEFAKQLAYRIEGLGLRGLDELSGRMFGKAVAELSSLEASGLIETLKEIEAGKIDVLAALRGAAA